MSIVTRTCHRCKVEQPIDQFYVKAEARAAIRKGKKHKMPCRKCQQRYQAERRAPRQALADKIKMDAGCMDCGLRPEYAQVLEFDHRPDPPAHVKHRSTRTDWRASGTYGKAPPKRWPTQLSIPTS